MFKTLLALSVLGSITVTSAQKTLYDPWSLEAQVGFNNPVNPMASGYDASSLGPFHTGLGVRYMLNPKFGLRLQTGYDQFRNSGSSLHFSTNYFRTSVEGVVNAGNVFRFYDWSKRFGLLLHAGFGYSVMKGHSDYPGNDQMLHVLAGITPQFRLSDRWVISLDVTSIAHIYQSRTYDFTQFEFKRGVDGYLYNLSFGVQYNFGKGTHADWIVPVDLSQQLNALDQRLSDLQQQQRDDDNDGVANYLDQEPGTPAGVEVNTKGQTVVPPVKDSDSDGISDELDACPFMKGTQAANGCPDADNDGFADQSDPCPLLAGPDKGCPAIAPETKQLFVSTAQELQFAPGKAVVPVAAHSRLDEVAHVLIAHPEYELMIAAHSGAEGDDLKNRVLTQQQADAVKRYLVLKGVASDRITALGFGETQPVADTSTKEGNARNKRVALDIRF
jgi:OOP family OmpA-OmpF porin